MGQGTGIPLVVAQIEGLFPKLKPSGYKLTSLRTPQYNCIAWAAGDSANFWWPDPPGYWPPGVPRQRTMAAFIAAYATVGYAPCADGTLEIGFERVALYADGNGLPTHAARQLVNGRWTSKLGKLEDIEHELVGVEGDSYGTVAQYLRRPLKR